MEAPFGLVIVTVIVVVAVPPTDTLEGLNDFDIVRGSPWARSDGAHAAMTRVRRRTRRRTSMIRAPLPEEYSVAPSHRPLATLPHPCKSTGWQPRWKRRAPYVGRAGGRPRS